MAAKKSRRANARAASNGKKWTRVERKRYRFWRPDDDSDALTGIVIARQERDGKFGRRTSYFIRATEGGSDTEGAYKAGDELAVNEYATLRCLADLGRKEVRITPAGVDDSEGKGVYLFDVDVAG